MSAIERVKDPFQFARLLWPDVKFYNKQMEIIQSVMDNDETFVPAGHQLGKDFVSGFIVLWYFLTHHPVRIVTTSADHAQLESVLWGEIRRFIQTAKYPLEHTKGGPLVNNHLHLRKIVNGEMCGISYVLGRVAAKGEGMAGHHAENTLWLGDEACHDRDTDVLTDEGWKRFSDLNGDELFLTMNPETRIAEYRPSTKLYRSAYSGPMYLMDRRSSNFCVTPNHRMLWRTRKPWKANPWSSYDMEPICNLSNAERHIPRTFEWVGESPDYYILPRWMSGHGSPHSIMRLPMRDWLRFLGWYISEGYVMYAGERPKAVIITQKDRVSVSMIVNIIRRLGFIPLVNYGDCSTITIGSTRLATYLSQFGRYSYGKHIPKFIGGLSSDLIEIFLNTYKMGDGYDRGPDRQVIYTCSKAIADELQILSFKAGREATVQMRKLIGLPAPNGISRHDGYVIGRRGEKDNHIKISRRRISIVDYEGEIFCVCVPPYHTIFTRRDGTCMWSGNSGVDDLTYERVDTWAKRKLVIGNPYHGNSPNCTFFFRCVKGGDIERKSM